jgi:hypothetical protein
MTGNPKEITRFNLAKVRVGRSNRLARSRYFKGLAACKANSIKSIAFQSKATSQLGWICRWYFRPVPQRAERSYEASFGQLATASVTGELMKP